ncbi:transcriptional regulator [Camelimonas fluminis]|uniref:Winged helix-turn-helix transcriptional regulator n=1 Tax=Camelimonas fluminis TaxID=1576911 RepID=A0ABV7UMA8_9HYPH|nr:MULTISPECIES: helix-turn-helix domain-containing protein [Camelimonas]GHE75222.1 transcriptional regulator [Camelimonas fluminis]
MDKESALALRTKTQRPIMVLLDLLGRRWALRVLWELRDAPLTSRALRDAAGGISPTVLQTRMNELREAGFVQLDNHGYSLTPLGRDLLKAFKPLYSFADIWVSTVKPVGADPE